MLERGTLLIHGWTQKEENGSVAWIRTITDPANQPLGFVRLDGTARGAWLSWFRRVRFDVFETEDASHLMNLTRSWGMLRSWEVDDAEDRHVGTIYAQSIVSSDGERLASIDANNPDRVRLLDAGGVKLGEFSKTAVGVEVIFALPPNPFLRMLVLGCALARDPGPNR